MVAQNASMHSELLTLAITNKGKHSLIGVEFHHDSLLQCQWLLPSLPVAAAAQRNYTLFAPLECAPFEHADKFTNHFPKHPGHSYRNDRVLKHDAHPGTCSHFKEAKKGALQVGKWYQHFGTLRFK